MINIPIVRNVAVKTTRHAERATPRGIRAGVNATLVLNECSIMKFLRRVDKTGFITATATVMKQHHVIKSN